MISKWEWSLEIEAKRILHIARNIATGFYEKNNFIVLPPEYLKQYKEVVIFPNLEIKKIKDFWDRVKKIDAKDWSKFEDEDLLKRVVQLLQNGRIIEPNVKKIKRIWQWAEKDTIKEIERVLNLSASIHSISIYPSNFGPSVSFNVHKKSPYKIGMFLRKDRNIHTIAEAITSSLIQNDLLNTIGANFKEKEIMIDWLVGQSAIGKVLNKYDTKKNFLTTTQFISKKQRSHLNEISNKFLKKLGYYGKGNDKFSLKNNQPIYNSEPINDLTWQEKRTLSLLISNRNKLVSIDAIGQEILREEDEFSPWAMAKFIQRLRDKLEQNGISRSYIQTIRKRGYLLR